jgi:type II secretory pathway component PulJ
MSPEWVIFAMLAFIAWHWWDGLQKRELALQAAQRLCAQAGVQFLDSSVALRRLSLRRDENQHARLYREFAFEYSTSGDDRQPGRVYMLGARVLSASLIQSGR